MKNIIRMLTVILVLALSYAVFLSFRMRDDKITNIGNEDKNIEEVSQVEKDDDNGEHGKKFEAIISRNLDLDYPNSYVDLMTYYNQIVEYLYSGVATNEEIATLIGIQRKLYAEEILMLNTYDEQLAHAIEEISNFTSNGNKIFQTEIELIEIYETSEENNIVEMRVLYRVTRPPNTDMKYYLIKEDNLWKIVSFKLTEGDSVITE